MSYWRFAAMIATSTIVMFGLMYLNTYAFEHVFFSETRTYMALLMGAVMAVIMLSFMLSMYDNKAINIAIYVGSIAVFAGTLWLVRSQVTVGDTSYMRAMIPHHSIAIMTSERAELSDPRVKKMAEGIIAAQRKEIAEMRSLIADIEENGDATDPELGNPDEPAKVGTVEEAMASAELAGIDPAGLKPEDVEGLLGGPAVCEFRRTNEGEPTLIMAQETGGIKMSGTLVKLTTEAPVDEAALADGARYTAEGIEVSVAPIAGADWSDTESNFRRSEAEMKFHLDRGLTVAYRGFLGCRAEG
ncbi:MULTISPECIES: DUF305 domain-containing protein [Rhodobacterales]|uniref:DUF305 domain-containing protein n=1 Tax=Thalassorhabdomicrobium marinisediminis TaxID=2170577 RepID=A0A2T7FZ57_9RHOB|nr:MULTISPECIES: DUF305 domain-containing protein [Rhodobacterales]PVA07442.1 DUF305 domain-containing protein [Thalassorhabdomicrobium marinisediminis]UOA32881.1 hypothetical protein DSM110093_02688 [Sulfitobacter sp. DSM 110093]